jgi:integrase
MKKVEEVGRKQGLYKDAEGETQYSGWKDQLAKITLANNDKRKNGAIASGKTQEDRAKALFVFFSLLNSLGFKTEPRNIKERHVEAVVLEWERTGLKPGTIQIYLSHVRVFCEWLNKFGMVGEASKYVINKESVTRTYEATEDKSWDDLDIDKYEFLDAIFRYDRYVGMQVLLQDAFGLRRKESIRLRPYIAEQNDVLYISEGSKGGRFRPITVDTEYKRYVIDVCKAFVNFTERHMGNPELSLKQTMTRYNNTMKRAKVNGKTLHDLGVSGHGLRAGFAMRELQARGLIPLLRGGKIGQLPKDEELKIRREVSKLLGHNRPEIMTAYSGTSTVRGKLKLERREAETLQAMVESMVVGQKYIFQTFETTTEDGMLIEAQKLERVFLGTDQIEDRFYFDVQRTQPEVFHKIGLELVRSICVLPPKVTTQYRSN